MVTIAMRQPQSAASLIRLNKIIAHSGVCSRRRADELIRNGRVTVNGAVVTQCGRSADIHNDSICVDGKPLKREKKMYIMLHKPAGYITTVSDPHAEKTVFDLLPHIPVRLFPVGRLDKETSGLLVLTNDGDISYQLTHPKFAIEREYQARVRGRIRAAVCQRIETGGIPLGDYDSAPCIISRRTTGPGVTDIVLIIREGRNREIRRIFRAVNHPVINLTRVRFGALRLGNLPPGSWRYLSRSELNSLPITAI